MLLSRFAVTGLAVFALTACEAAPPADNEAEATPVAAEVASEAAVVQLSGEGLTVAGPDESVLAFGAARDAAERAVAVVLGVPEGSGAMEECGAGPMEFTNYPGGLTLNFMDGSLVGWTLNQAAADFAIKTTTSIGIGSPAGAAAEALDAVAMADSTLGDEFYSETSGIGGFYVGEGDARTVDSLYAGTTCFFR